LNLLEKGGKMSEIDLQLYNYLIDHSSAITDEWFSGRAEKNGSIYSLNADKSVEDLLREQNRLTNLTVASILLNEKEIFEKNKEKWAIELANSRIGSNTPIHEVLEAFGKLRKVYWMFVENFVALNNDKVARSDLLKWGIILHTALDELKADFSEVHYKIMATRLSFKRNLIEELSSPIIRITSSIGILPLIGEIDTKRAKNILGNFFI